MVYPEYLHRMGKCLYVLREGISKIGPAARFNIINITAMGDTQQQRNESGYVARCKLTFNLKDSDEKLIQIRKNGLFSLFHEGKPFVNTDAIEHAGFRSAHLLWLGLHDLTSLPIKDSEQNSVLLDITKHGIARFAISIPYATDKDLDEICKKFNGSFADLRAAFLYMLNAESASIARQGSSLLHWMHNAKFCQRCGAKLVRNAAGNHKKCVKCGRTHYPYTAPAIITLVVEDGTDRCVLVRQPQFIAGWYTAIAGFVDIGESLENAVRREVAEEVGLEVDRLEYFNSQHWPIPTSTLMLACIAHVKPGQQLDVDNKELEDAQWVSRQELADIYKKVKEDSTMAYLGVNAEPGKVYSIPMAGTSANELISYWLTRCESKL